MMANYKTDCGTRLINKSSVNRGAGLVKVGSIKNRVREWKRSWHGTVGWRSL